MCPLFQGSLKGSQSYLYHSVPENKSYTEVKGKHYNTDKHEHSNGQNRTNHVA